MASSSERTDARVGFGMNSGYKTDTRKVGTISDTRGHWWQGDSAMSHVEPTQREKEPDSAKTNPIVYMEYTADDENIGRVVIELQADFVPNSGTYNRSR